MDTDGAAEQPQAAKPTTAAAESSKVPSSFPPTRLALERLPAPLVAYLPRLLAARGLSNQCYAEVVQVIKRLVVVAPSLVKPVASELA